MKDATIEILRALEDGEELSWWSGRHYLLGPTCRNVTRVAEELQAQGLIEPDPSEPKDPQRPVDNMVLTEAGRMKIKKTIFSS